MVLFFCHEELITVYKSLFASDVSTWFEKGAVGVTVVENLADVLHYYDNIVKKRNSRRPPLAVELTFEIIRYYVTYHKICTTTKDVSMMKELLSNLLMASATKVFKIVNQIVDLNQKSKFALSFSHILKQLDFKHPGLLAHVRNGFFHQEMPAQTSILNCFETLLADTKRLFWDKVFAWYVQTFCDPKTGRQMMSDFRAFVLDKATLNDVDEYSDRCLAQQDLRLHLADNMDKSNNKEAASAFIKHKVKGLHRKTVVALLVAVEAELLAKEQLVSVSPLLTSKAAKLEQLLAILQQLLEIFQSNENMHAILDASPLRETVASLLSLLQVSGNWQSAVATFDRFMTKKGGSQSSLMLNMVTESAALGKREASTDDELPQSSDIKTSEHIHSRAPLKIGYNLQKFMANDPQSFAKAIKAARQLAY